MHHLGYSSENLLQDGVGLCFLGPVGLDLQAHGTWSGNKPAIKISWHPSISRHRKIIFEVKEKYIGTRAIQSPGGVISTWAHVSDCPLFLFYSSMTRLFTVILRNLASSCRIKEEVGTAQQGEANCFSLFDTFGVVNHFTKPEQNSLQMYLHILLKHSSEQHSIDRLLWALFWGADLLHAYFDIW